MKRAREARAARAKAIEMMVVGNEEGDSKGGKGDGNRDKVVGNKESYCEGGKGNNSNGNDNGRQQRGQWQGG
jgi:hypothetical protein